MRGYNRIILMGNLVREPEIKYTSDKRGVANFTVAVNRQYKDANGDLQEDVIYMPVVAWAYLAEFCQNYLHKGDGVLVEGRVSMRSYDAKNGDKKSVTEVIASSIQFAGMNSRTQNSGVNYTSNSTRQTTNRRNSYTPQEMADRAPVEDMEMPF